MSHQATMKTKLRLLLLAVASGSLLSSCVVDPYGMPVAGVGYAAPAYSNVSYYDSGYWGRGNSSPFLFPASTSFTYVRGGYGGSCGRPVYVSPSRSCSTGGSYFFRSSGSHHHRYSSFPSIAPTPSFHGSDHGAPFARPSLPSPGGSPFFSHLGSGAHGGHRPSFATLSSSGAHHPGSGSSSHGHGHRH